MNKGNKNSEDRKFIKKCFHVLWINSTNETTPPWLIRFEQWFDFLSIIVWKIFFSIFFIHANCIIHKIVSIFSRFKNPYTNCILWMIDCFQFIIYFADFFWDFCLNTNHDSKLFNSHEVYKGVYLLVCEILLKILCIFSSIFIRSKSFL